MVVARQKPSGSTNTGNFKPLTSAIANDRVRLRIQRMTLSMKRSVTGMLCCALMVLQMLPLCCCSSGWCAGIAIDDGRSAIGPAESDNSACHQSGCCSRVHQNNVQAAPVFQVHNTACDLDTCGHQLEPVQSCPCEACFLKKAQVATVATGGILRLTDFQAISLDFGFSIPSSTSGASGRLLAASPFAAIASTQLRLAWICAWLK